MAFVPFPNRVRWLCSGWAAWPRSEDGRTLAVVTDLGTVAFRAHRALRLRPFPAALLPSDELVKLGRVLDLQVHRFAG